MKAVQLIGYGDAVQNLEVHDVAEPPAPSTGEVLIGMEYAPINFNDLMVPWGVFPWKPQPPATIGNEGSGVILAVGQDVTEVAVGDRVVVPPLVDDLPTYQQRLIARASDLVVVPAHGDPVQASMLGINAVTAELLLSEYVQWQPGDAVVFNSATSGLSQWLVVLAKQRGLTTVGVVRQQADVETVKARGCDVVIVDDEAPAVTALKIEGLHIPLGLDVLGGPSTNVVASLLSPGAKLVNFGGVARKPMEIAPLTVIGKRLTITGYFQTYPDMQAKGKAALQKVAALLPTGVTQPVAGIFTLDRLKEAVSLAQAGKKVVLKLDGAA